MKKKIIVFVELSELIDIAVLSQSLPGLVSFSTTARDLTPDENYWYQC